MENGKIAEFGTYSELMEADSTFARLARDFGGETRQSEENENDGAAIKPSSSDQAEAAGAAGAGGERVVKEGKGLMQVEERVVGTLSTYRSFLSAANGIVTVPLLLATLALMSASFVLSNLSLVWWQQDRFNLDSSEYSGIYAGLGISLAAATFAMGVCSVFIGVGASNRLHARAVDMVIRAPLSFYDTTPLGRMLNRFAKDIETIDSRLNDAARMALATLAQILGAVIVVALVSQYFLIAVGVCAVIYFLISSFYRASARAIKRHDNVLRSSLYAWFSESLAGMSSIRAFGETERFQGVLDYNIDLENRAYLLTVINQRWLQIRLDFLGACLTLVVSFIVVGQRTTISPSHVGLALSSIVAIQQSLSMVIRQSAEVENSMSSVERLAHYGNQLEQEAPAIIENMRPPTSWPGQGAINFDNVVMSYRPGLPQVLRGLSFSVQGGEKIGIVGR